jgi:hypothetical protein
MPQLKKRTTSPFAHDQIV